MSGLRHTQRLLHTGSLSAVLRSSSSVPVAIAAAPEAVLARLAPSAGCTSSGQQPHLPGFHSSPSAWQPGCAVRSFASSAGTADAHGDADAAADATAEQYTQIGRITSYFQVLSHSCARTGSIPDSSAIKVRATLAAWHIARCTASWLRLQVPRKLAFAVVEVGPTQFKVSQGDIIVTEKLRGVDVNDKISLNRVLMLGSPHETIIGRPFIPAASVTAAVEAGPFIIS